MAISQSSLPIWLPGVFHRFSSQPGPPLPSLSLVKPSPVPVLLRTLNRGVRAQPPRAAREDSMSAIISDLEPQKTAEQVDTRQPQDGVASRWRVIHGRDDWAGLLDPIDPLLRTELIRYGEFVQACYDSFDYDKFSRYCGSCKYSRRQFFSSLGMESAGYDVTRYLYATSNVKVPKFFAKSVMGSRTWSERANWIGYVSVSNDETTARLGRRDILIAWRGTVTRLEWIHDFMANMQPVRSAGIPCPDTRIKVETGFVDLYIDKDATCRFCKYSAREQVLTEVRKLVAQYTKAGEEVSITVAGHSLGSALATLNAYDIAEMELNKGDDGKQVPMAVFSYGGPRVGNEHFKERCDKLGLKVLRVVNVHDKVPTVPGVLINEHMPGFMLKAMDGYVHFGVELLLDHKHSPFLKDSLDPSNYHNLEAHLHLLDGYAHPHRWLFHGKGRKFALATGRDPALVNKSCDFLHEHLMVPPNWRQDENKGMMRSQEGRWTQPARPKIDDHPEDIHHHYQQLGLDRFE
ncbi:hypothetical protein BHE74_00043056 [Ensete ventricosum]|nr:hypothetical protein GW17_00024458 [Ensete ventricosum]RWW50667.1 hypothetical protein BHE74_00043056 [Ensete ventricosum]